MFKSQMKLQKILCFVALILAALVFVYALGFGTPFYDLLFSTVSEDDGYDYTEVEGTLFFWELQTKVANETNGTHREVGFIDQLLIVSIVDIGVALVLFITNTHTRRKYYLGNYVATGIYAGFNVGIAAWILARLSYFIGAYAKVDQVALEAHCNSTRWKRPYTPNTPNVVMYLGIALCVLILIVAILVVLNLVWKLQLQKRENKLLSQSSSQEVAVNG